MKLTDDFTRGDFISQFIYGTFHLKIFILQCRSLNIFNGITVRFLRLWRSLYKVGLALALSLKIPCPHLFSCRLNFSFYLTSPLNTSQDFFFDHKPDFSLFECLFSPTLILNSPLCESMSDLSNISIETPWRQRRGFISHAQPSGH